MTHVMTRNLLAMLAGIGLELYLIFGWPGAAGVALTASLLTLVEADK